MSTKKIIKSSVPDELVRAVLSTDIDTFNTMFEVAIGVSRSVMNFPIRYLVSVLDNIQQENNPLLRAATIQYLKPLNSIVPVLMSIIVVDKHNAIEAICREDKLRVAINDSVNLLMVHCIVEHLIQLLSGGSRHPLSKNRNLNPSGFEPISFREFGRNGQETNLCRDSDIKEFLDIIETIVAES